MPKFLESVSVGNVLTIILMAAGLAGSYAAISADGADLKRRVTHLEQGEQKTHALIKNVERKVDETKEGQHLILQELRAMQAVDRERNLGRMREDAARRREER